MDDAFLSGKAVVVWRAVAFEKGGVCVGRFLRGDGLKNGVSRVNFGGARVEDMFDGFVVC